MDRKTIIMKFKYRKDYITILNKIAGHLIVGNLKLNYGKNIIAIENLGNLVNKYHNMIKNTNIKNVMVQIRTKKIQIKKELFNY